MNLQDSHTRPLVTRKFEGGGRYTVTAQIAKNIFVLVRRELRRNDQNCMRCSLIKSIDFSMQESKCAEGRMQQRFGTYLSSMLTLGEEAFGRFLFCLVSPPGGSTS